MSALVSPSSTVWGPCAVCATDTEWICADCGIDSGGEKIVHVCAVTACMEKHEAAAKCAPKGAA